MKYAIPCMCLEESKPLNLPLAQFKRPGFSTLDTPFEYRDLFTPLPSKRCCKPEFSFFLFSCFIPCWARPESSFKVSPHISLLTYSRIWACVSGHWTKVVHTHGVTTLGQEATG